MKAMSHLPEAPDNNENDDLAFLNYFRSGMSWKQLLLYIYKHYKIIFGRSCFRDHFDHREIRQDFLFPIDRRSIILRLGGDQGN